MSETTSTFGALFDTPRQLVDGTIETQRGLSKQGLELSRQSAKAFAGLVPAQDASGRVDDLFDDIESTQDEVFDSIQDALGHGIDRVEETTGDVEAEVEEAVDDATDATEDAAEEVQETLESTADAASDVAEGVSVDDIDGVGPTYAERLVDAGFATVSDLADASADAVAEAANVSESRADEWIQQARDQN